METEVPALAGCGRYGSRDGEYRKDAVDAALKSDSIPDELGTRYPPSWRERRTFKQQWLYSRTNSCMLSYLKSVVCRRQGLKSGQAGGERLVALTTRARTAWTYTFWSRRALGLRPHASMPCKRCWTPAMTATYQYRAQHPMLRWLPSKFAKWIGDNYGPLLGIPPKNHDDGWTVA